MEKTIKAIIVDDEPYSRDELKHLLSAFASIQIVGEAESGESAVMKTLQLQPDVVFLDVEMPKMNGMEAAKALLELKNVPLIVFTTAYPQFAAEAFRLNAVDYLLKPYDEDQLKETIERVEKEFAPVINSEAGKYAGKLAVEADGEIIYLEPKDIVYVFRDKKMTRIIARNGDYETRATLKDLENRLNPYSFFRVHKSYLVNLGYVTRLTPWFNGAFQLEMEGREELVSVSRNYVKALRAKLEI